MKLYADTSLVRLQFLMLAGIVVSTVLDMDSLSSMLFTMTFFLTVGFWLTVAEKKIDTLSLLAILIIFISCISVLINAMVTNTVLSFSYLKKMIMFWSTLIFIATAYAYTPDRAVVRFLFRVNMLIVLFLIGMYFLQTENMFLWKERVTTYLTFRFTNPNLMAVFLTSLCILELLSAYASEKWLARLFHLVLAGFLVFFVVLTRSRTALLLLVAFLAFFAVTVLFPRLKLKMTGWMAALIAVFPIVLALVYMLVVNMDWFQEIFAFLVEEGKPLTSRVRIWDYGFSNFLSSPVVGAYSQIVNSQEHAQMHNTHVDILASYGLPVLVLFMRFLYVVFNQRVGAHVSRTQTLCMFGAAAIMLTGVAEAMLFSGGLGIYIPVGGIIMLSNYDFSQKK